MPSLKSPDRSPERPAAEVEFRVLGPVEAVVAGRRIDLGAPKQRAVLALLVSQVGQPVSVDVLLEELWEGGHRHRRSPRCTRMWPI